MTDGPRLPVLALGLLASGWALLTAGPAWSAAAASPSGDAAAVRHWYGQVVTDLHPLQSALVGGLQAASSWRGGSESAAAADREMVRDLPQLQRVQAELQRLKPPAGHAAARDDYADGVGLYVDAFRLEKAATASAPPALVAQLQRSFERIRELGDVTFDQGTAQLAPELGPSIAGTDATAASHIPDWSSLGLAPAEPLVSSWAGPAAPPTEPPSASAWSTAVRTDGAPSQSSVRSALAGPATLASLSELARALDRSEVALGSVATPPPDAPAAAVLRLGLLTDAEAVLVADAAAQGGRASTAELQGVARSLSSAGAALRGAAVSAG